MKIAGSIFSMIPFIYCVVLGLWPIFIISIATDLNMVGLITCTFILQPKVLIWNSWKGPIIP
jgi:hypothetical protein